MAFSKKDSKPKNGRIPNLPRRLFWDCNYDKIDWQTMYGAIIDRVIEKGSKEEWDEMVRYYGKSKVVNALKSEITYLPDYVINDVRAYFELKEEELACYERKKIRRGHWI